MLTSNFDLYGIPALQRLTVQKFKVILSKLGSEGGQADINSSIFGLVCGLQSKQKLSKSLLRKSLAMSLELVAIKGSCKTVLHL